MAGPLQKVRPSMYRIFLEYTLNTGQLRIAFNSGKNFAY